MEKPLKLCQPCSRQNISVLSGVSMLISYSKLFLIVVFFLPVGDMII